MGEKLELKLKSPVGAEAAGYPWPLPVYVSILGDFFISIFRCMYIGVKMYNFYCMRLMNGFMISVSLAAVRSSVAQL